MGLWEKDIWTSTQVSKNVKECLRYDLKPRNTGYKTYTTKVFVGKMFLYPYEGVMIYMNFCPTAVV